jgi:hypothetical protein
VRIKDDVPELLIFVADRFGGDDLGINHAGDRTVNGGMVGTANSPGPPIDGKPGPYYQYVFGAGQGSITAVEVEEPEARVELVNPEVDGWVVVVPNTIGAATMQWKLIGSDGTVVFESVGTGMPSFGMQIDESTRAFVQLRDGEPELQIFTPNAFGGAQLATSRADHPTIGDGFAGTATTGGYRFLFGAGQGELRSDRGIQVREPPTGDPGITEARAELVNGRGWGWVIVVPDTVAIDDLEWQLVDPEGTVLFEATGLEGQRP